MFKPDPSHKFSPRRERWLKGLRKGITRGNIWLLKISRGRLGNSFLGTPTLLLTTTGRKSGQPRTIPLYYRTERARLLLVASNAGTSRDPDWLLNIRAQPLVTVRIRGRTQPMRARVASMEENQQLWPSLLATFPLWQMMFERSHRVFPIVILEPTVA
ncbi:MAG: nitroreductase family deazaflavin-dependent oxidoreductase [Candidatus Binatia bacterium]